MHNIKGNNKLRIKVNLFTTYIKKNRTFDDLSIDWKI